MLALDNFLRTGLMDLDFGLGGTPGLLLRAGRAGFSRFPGIAGAALRGDLPSLSLPSLHSSSLELISLGSWAMVKMG